MDGIEILALAEVAIDYVDDKYGRGAAWAVALSLLALLIGLAAGVIIWMGR